MKTLAKTEILTSEKTADNDFSIDTTFVLFFLAVEMGQNIGNSFIETAFLSVTLVLFMVLPYFLSQTEIKFGNWIFGRALIASFAIFLGILFKQTLGVVLPETFKFLPMTLLILTAMVSFYIQFYSFFKLRLAK